MPSTLTKPAPRTHLDGVQLRPAKVQVEVQVSSGASRTETNRPDLDVLQEALSTADLSWKAFAISADASKSQVSDAVNGRGNVAWAWLWRQDDEFWQTFWPLVAQHKKISVPNRRKQLARQAMGALLQLMEEEE